MIEVKLDEIWVQKHLFTVQNNNRYLKLTRQERDFVYGALLRSFFQNLKGILAEITSGNFTPHNGPRNFDSNTRITAFCVQFDDHPFEITIHEVPLFNAWVVSVIETTIPMGTEGWVKCQKKALPKQVFTSLVSETLEEYKKTLTSTELRNVKEFFESTK